MFSTRCRSSRHTPPGRHISLRLQLEHVTSNLRGASFLAMVSELIGSLGAGLRGAFDDCLAHALGDNLAHALEFRALVEETARAEVFGELAVWKCREIRQQVEVDLRRLRAHRAQHVEAASRGERSEERR